jgi:hypothetical protein
VSRESNSAKKNSDLFLVPRAAQQVGQLGDVGGDAPGFVAGEQVGSRAPAGVTLEVDVGNRLTLLSLTMKQEAFASSMSHGGGKRRDVMRSF